jgi:predicted enzyme related to lactoylglutathione lyase
MAIFIAICLFFALSPTFSLSILFIVCFTVKQLEEIEMNRVTGIGGIFFKANNPVELRAWYKKHLGVDVQDWGGTAFSWSDSEGKTTAGSTVWCISGADGEQFTPSKSSFMINYRVEDVDAVLKLLREEGCNVLDKTDNAEYGKFGWVLDPEGNKVELWQPPLGQ